MRPIGKPQGERPPMNAKITVTRNVSAERLDDARLKSVASKSVSTRVMAAKMGWGCERLVEDAYPAVRAAAARSLLDPSRYAGARDPERMDWAKKLSRSPNAEVRGEVARGGLMLQALSGDSSWQVRAWVAAQGEGDVLEGLRHDDNEEVRRIAEGRAAMAALAADSAFGYDTPYTDLDDFKSMSSAFPGREAYGERSEEVQQARRSSIGHTH